ncbi:MAG TPA: hypothetical protein PK359_19945, partial [Burkholderiaceae bacterium]|nr:hypothetical protein [Burkholderiaceae bacterium]
PARPPVTFVESNWQVGIEAWRGTAARRLVLRWPVDPREPSTAPGPTGPQGAEGGSPANANVTGSAPARPLARQVELRLVVDEGPGESEPR